MARKELPDTGFGARLASIRKSRGITQVQLAEAIDSNQPGISYYESKGGYPPAPVLTKLARALGVSTDALLGLTLAALAALSAWSVLPAAFAEHSQLALSLGAHLHAAGWPSWGLLAIVPLALGLSWRETARLWDVDRAEDVLRWQALR